MQLQVATKRRARHTLSPSLFLWDSLLARKAGGLTNFLSGDKCPRFQVEPAGHRLANSESQLRLSVSPLSDMFGSSFSLFTSTGWKCCNSRPQRSARCAGYVPGAPGMLSDEQVQVYKLLH